jgi:hypothetical protein
MDATECGWTLRFLPPSAPDAPLERTPEFGRAYWAYVDRWARLTTPPEYIPAAFGGRL